MRFRSLLRVHALLALLLAVALPAVAQTGNHVAGDGAGTSLTTGEFNTIVGDDSNTALTTESRNVSLGYTAGQYSRASGNVFIGWQSGYDLFASAVTIPFIGPEGTGLVFIGADSGGEGTTGYDNTFVGTEAGEATGTGYGNTFFGEEAGANNTTGYANTYIGQDAGFSSTSSNNSGYFNTFVGNEVGVSTANGIARNTAVGSRTFRVIEGDRNTALGDASAVELDEGRYNTILGQDAGAETRYANFNTFVGAAAGFENNSGNGTANANRNTYVGYRAGFTNSDGQDNVGLGHNADFSDDEIGESRNVFIGAETLVRNGDNVLLGYSTGSTVNQAVAIGSEADVAGANGIAIGASADLDSQNGVLIGAETVGTGESSIALGYQSSVSGDNSIAIGYGTSVAADNEAYIGNAATTSIGGSVNWMAMSDARLKTDVSRDVPGLDFVRRLRPVRYRFDLDGLHALSNPASDLSDALAAKSAQWQTGFLAQEVESAAEAADFAFSGVVSPVEGRQHYGLRYAEFVVPLTQAVQEVDAAYVSHATHAEQQAARIAALQAVVAEQAALIASRHEQITTQADRLAAWQQLLEDYAVLAKDYEALVARLSQGATAPLTPTRTTN
ncbi:MAG: tail fiber domain-containing protein [Bacteroidota bacterium]